MAFLAAAAPYVALAGTAVSALGAINQGQAAAANARYQAQVAANNQVIASQNAAYAIRAGETSAYDAGLKNRAALGRVVAGMAAEGVDVNTGSAAEVRQGQQEIGLTAVERVRQQAALEAYGYKVQASNFGTESGLLTAEAGQEEQAAFLSAGGTLLSGVGQFGGKFNWPTSDLKININDPTEIASFGVLPR